MSRKERTKSVLPPADHIGQSAARLEQHFCIYNTDLFNAHIGQGLVAIREEWPDEFKRRLAAAVVSTNLGIGLDYAYKKYGRYMQQEPLVPDPIDREYERLFYEIEATAGEVYSFEKPQAPEQEFFGGFGLLRALATLRAAHALAQWGYLSESVSTCRLAIEQICWAIHSSRSKTADRILLDSTQFCISRTKGDMPSVGKFYGLTSKFAHWHPEVHLSYLRVEPIVRVVSQGVVFKPTAILFCLTANLYYLIAFRAHMKHHWPEVDISMISELLSETGAFFNRLVDCVDGIEPMLLPHELKEIFRSAYSASGSGSG